MKCGGKRPRRKAGLGADGALIAAATLAAAGMNVAATTAAAKQQAEATTRNADVQAKTITEQTRNNTQLQKDSLSFQAEQKQQDRDLMNDINMTMQMMAGRQNSNDILNANRMQAKFGKGQSKRNKLRATQPSYRGANTFVETTDGGQAVPIDIDNNGYGIYELRGDNHEQYHKTQEGEYKSGVGVRTQSGEVVEGEGSKTDKPGELYIKKYDGDYFLSRHTIGGFNPTNAVLAGVDPDEAYIIQEINKARLGLADDGSKAKYGKRCSLKCGGRKKANFGFAGVAGPIWVGNAVYNANKQNNGGGKNNSSGGNNFWGNYGGAALNAGANIVGAGFNWLGNYLAGRMISKANQQAYDKLNEAYGNLQTIDMDWAANEFGWNEESPKALAAIREANVSDKPQRERINRDARYEIGEVNRSTMSSAARQQRLAGIDDRRQQRLSEIAADTNNRRESIQQNNIAMLNDMAKENVNRDIQWRSGNNAQRLQLALHNNSIENLKITGPAQAYSDMITGNANQLAALNNASIQGFNNALMNSASGFASTYDGLRQERQNWLDVMAGATNEGQISAAIGRNDKIGRDYAYSLYQSYMEELKRNPTNKVAQEYVNRLRGKYNFV